jgi:hypothetical protein
MLLENAFVHQLSRPGVEGYPLPVAHKALAGDWDKKLGF